MNTQFVYLYFNDETRLPAFFSGKKIEASTSIYKEIDLEKDLGITDGNFNLARYRWDGDFDTGNLVDLFEQKRAIVTEEEINKKYNGLFFRKYSIENVLFSLIKEVGVNSRDTELEKMYKFLIMSDRRKANEIFFYKDSPNHIYESDEFRSIREASSFKVDTNDES